MAAGQLPRHDFAPAWLKLPASENSAWKQGTADRLFYPPAGGERSLGRQSRPSGSVRGGVAYDDLIAQPQSFHQPHHLTRPRFYSNEYHDDYDITLNGTGLRSGSRQGQGSRSHVQVNGAFCEQQPQQPGYLSRRSAAVVNGLQSATKKPQRPKDARSGSVSGIGNGHSRKPESSHTVTTTTVPVLDDEFPSLNGDPNTENSKPAGSKVSSVWDSPSRTSKSSGRLASSNAEAGHKALVLKTGSAKKWNGQSSSGTMKIMSGVRDGAKEINAPAEGLSACLVTHPKNLGDKKSNFLRSLRRESHESDSEINGFEASNSGPTSPALDSDNMAVFAENVSANCSDAISGESSCSAGSTHIELILSKSHEAEQRLLREMGWKDTDEDDEHYEITEADVREFENLCRQLQVSKRNGLAHELPAKNCCPRAAMFPVFSREVQLLPDVETLSSDSLSDSSDDDVDEFGGNAS